MYNVVIVYNYISNVRILENWIVVWYLIYEGFCLIDLVC